MNRTAGALHLTGMCTAQLVGQAGGTAPQLQGGPAAPHRDRPHPPASPGHRLPRPGLRAGYIRAAGNQ